MDDFIIGSFVVAVVMLALIQLYDTAVWIYNHVEVTF